MQKILFSLFVVLYLGILTFLFVEQTYYDQPSWHTIPNKTVRSWSSFLSGVLVLQTCAMLYILYKRGELTLKIRLIFSIMVLCTVAIAVLGVIRDKENIDGQGARFATRLLKAIFGLCATMMVSSLLQKSVETTGIINGIHSYWAVEPIKGVVELDSGQTNLAPSTG